MDLKFTFGAANPLPLATSGTGTGGTGGSGASSASTLDLRVTLESGQPAVAVCEGLSGDGVAYARAEKAVQDPASASELAAAVRSVLARVGAELPEPLIDSVTGIVLALGGAEAEVLARLGITASASPDPSAPIAAVDEALQARTGVAAGVPIRVAR